MGFTSLDATMMESCDPDFGKQFGCLGCQMPNFSSQCSIRSDFGSSTTVNSKFWLASQHSAMPTRGGETKEAVKEVAEGGAPERLARHPSEPAAAAAPGANSAVSKERLATQPRGGETKEAVKVVACGALVRLQRHSGEPAAAAAPGASSAVSKEGLATQPRGGETKEAVKEVAGGGAPERSRRHPSEPAGAASAVAAAPGASNAVGGVKKAKTFKTAGTTKRTQEGQRANALKVFFQREIDRAYRQLGCPGRDQFCYEKTLAQLKQSVWPKAVKYYGKRVPDASADDVKHRTEEEVCLWFGHRRFEHVKPLPKKRKSSSSSSSSSSSESWNSSDDALLT